MSEKQTPSKQAQPAVDPKAITAPDLTAPTLEPEQAPEPDGPTFYGNKDTDKAHKLPKDWKQSVVVEQWQVDTLNGGMVEVPNTRTKQTYSKDVFEQMINDSKGSKNFFAESSMKFNVLHMPA